MMSLFMKLFGNLFFNDGIANENCFVVQKLILKLHFISCGLNVVMNVL